MKKIIALLLVIALTAGISIAGTTAYLQSEDSDVNVMTLGNVKIDQIEQERDEAGNLVNFTQAKPAFPAVGPVEWAGTGVNVNGTEYKVFTDELKNVVDKIVTVKNTGKSDAYVRTIVAIEAPGYDPNDLIHFNYNAGVSISEPVKVEVGGVEYVCFAFTYDDALAPGQTSAPSLMQVFLDSKATNEDVAKFGDTWEILVVSQAVQTAGFDGPESALNTAFGEVTAANVADWFAGMEAPALVYDAEGLVDALTAGESVTLANDIAVKDTTITIPSGKAAELNLNGHKLSGSSAETGKNRNLITVKGDLTVTGGDIVMQHTGADMGWGNSVSAFSVEGGTLTLENVKVENKGGSAMAYGVDVNTTGGESVLNIYNSTITSTYTAVRIFNNHKTQTGTVNLFSGTVDGASRDIWAQNPSASAVDENGIVNIMNGASYDVTVQTTSNNGRIYQFN